MANRKSNEFACTLAELNASIRASIALLDQQVHRIDECLSACPSSRHKGAVERAHQLVEAELEKKFGQRGARHG